MPLLLNIGQLATCRADGGQEEIHAIEGAALAWEGKTLTWAGVERDLPDRFKDAEQIDAGGRLVVPGLIDCHTHLAFAGSRADEFERRLRGESYVDIAKAGGGIQRTVAATRRTPFEALVERASRVLAGMARLGVTTVECKSGYGLDEATELMLLEVYRTLGAQQPLRLVPTLLAAHAVPPEYEARREHYLDVVCYALIPRVAREGLAAFCDVFVEEGAFSAEEGRRVLEAGRAHGLQPKVHADQLSDSGGALLAARVRAVSADHLEHVSEEAVARLREAGTIAVSLPVSAACLGLAPMPARRLIEQGVPVAVATDYNPGTSPISNLPLALWLACTMQRMTAAEALKGATIYAAKAIGREAEIGSLEPGKAADFTSLDAAHVAEWLYHFSPGPAVATWAGGQPVFQRGSTAQA